MVDRRQFEAGKHDSFCIFCTQILNILYKYIPAPQESVIGVVTARSGENWRVDIGSAHAASLDGLAFEGATKRNRPNLKVSLCAAGATLVLMTSIRLGP